MRGTFISLVIFVPPRNHPPVFFFFPPTLWAAQRGKVGRTAHNGVCARDSPCPPLPCGALLESIRSRRGLWPCRPCVQGRLRSWRTRVAVQSRGPGSTHECTHCEVTYLLLGSPACVWLCLHMRVAVLAYADNRLTIFLVLQPLSTLEVSRAIQITCQIYADIYNIPKEVRYTFLIIIKTKIVFCKIE